MSYNSKQLKVQSSAKKLPKPKDVDYISKMGYRDDSPFRDNPYNDIYTPNSIIDMSQTGIPLFANGQYLPPYSGMHDMGTENVREIPVAKKGGQKGLRKFTSKNIQTSLNDIMQRNTTLFGPSGKKRYKPDLNYKYGGWLEQYQGDQNGSETGTGKEVTSETNNFKSERDFLIAMANSSLFTDRYKNMTGGINNEETESFRKNVINNINNAKINVGITSTGKPWTDEGSLGAYVNQFPKAEDYIKNGIIPDNYDKFLYTNKGFPYHNIFTKNESPTVITHELSHASTFGDNLLSQFSPKLSKLKENESFVKKYSEPDYNRTTEHKSYIDEIRKYLYENKIYDAIKNNFTEDDYNKLIKERSKLNNKSDVKSAFDAILDPYDKDEVIKMFNSYTSLGKNNKQLPIAKYGGWLDQYQTGSQTKANPLLIQAFQQSLANQKINEQKAIDAKNQEIKNNPLGIKTLTTARDNTNVVPIRQQTTLSNIEADKKRNEADRLLKQQKKTQGTLRETPKEINPNEAWRLAASNYQGHDKEEMNRIINSSKTVEGLGALAGVTGGGLHALASIPAVANTLGLGFAAHGVHSLPSTYRTLVDPNESVYNKARALTYNTADFLGMKQAAEALKGIRTAGKWAYNNAARSVATSKESGLLSRAHELNPYAFKPNPESYYKVMPDAGAEDLINSGFVRPAEGSPTSYFNKGVPLDIRRARTFGNDTREAYHGYKGPYMVESNNPNAFDPWLQFPEPSLKFYQTKAPIPASDIKLYKEDWLQGYKEVPKQLPGSANAGVQQAGMLNPIEKIVLPSWQMQELPGLHLKSTMEGQAISKIVEPKTGLVNTEQALAIIGKESGGKEKADLIRQALGKNVPKKMDFNDFRKIVQDQLIPLERQFSEQASNYGIGRIGYPSPKRSSYASAISNNEKEIERLNTLLKSNGNIEPTTFESVDAIRKRLQIQLDDNIAQLNKSKKELSTLPLENQTLILGNKSKFGSGSDAHGNPEETLGHIHFLRDAEHPDILIGTQIQSDAFQGTNRTMPKVFNKESQLKSLEGMENIAKRYEEMAKTAKQIDSDTWELSDGSRVSKSVWENMGKGQREINAMKKSEIENFSQKSLLDKNHQERYLQEFMDYAGKRGDVNYIAIPTSETAAKVQGYKPMYKDEKEVISYIEELKKNPEKYKSEMENTTPEDLKFLNDILAGKKTGAIFNKEQQTILKKYSEYEKIAKKLGWEVEDIIIKGNTYKKIKIPKSFKGGKGQIKAFKQGGAIKKVLKKDLNHNRSSKFVNSQNSNWLNKYQ